MGKLTVKVCEHAKPQDNGKPKRYSDGQGLYLEVSSKGKYWRAAYRFQDRQKTASFGLYPQVSLQQARQAHALFKQQVAEGIDPNAEKAETKKAQRQAQTIRDGNSPRLFANIAQDWLETTAKAKGWTEKHRQSVCSNLNNHVLPAFSDVCIEALTAPAIMAHIRSIPHVYTAGFALENIKRICRHAFNLQLISYSPAELLKANEWLPAHKEQAMRHVLQPEIVGQVLLAIERAPAALPATRCFLRLLPYLFCRPSELREALWEELEGDMLHIKAERMKKRRLHLIPLSRQARALIEEMRVHTGHTPYILANTFGGKLAPITEGAAYKIMKSNLVAAGQSLHQLTTLHGWRHTASSLLHEKGYSSHLIEMQLAHADKNSIRGTYNHALYLEERKSMMQEWADYLDELKTKALCAEQTTDSLSQ